MYQETSKEAFDSIKPKLPSIRERVYNMIQSKGEEGLIYSELAVAFPSTSLSSGIRRATELAKAGRIKVKLDESGKKVLRKNQGGNNQQVWIAA
jgi:hypothetical protein